MDESATGSVNSWSNAFLQSGYGGAMHLRLPSVDRGVHSFVWAVVFFLVLYFGMVAVDVSKATALIISLLSAFLIFLFVRTRGT